VGPQKTGARLLREAAIRNRTMLAQRGLHVLNSAEGPERIARDLNGLHPDSAAAEVLRLLEASGAPSSSIAFYSSEAFFAAPVERAAAYEEAFARFAATLASRDITVEIAFVERSMEDLLTALALHHAARGDLKFVTPDLAPYLGQLRAYGWLKGFYFARFPTLHFDYGSLTAEGDLLANFLRLGYGIDTTGLQAAGAIPATSDEEVARGLSLAPLANWMEQFGSMPRAEMFEAPEPVRAPLEGEPWRAAVESAALLRDCVRGNARRAIERYVAGGTAVAA
jgi:hypothetical protein